MNREDFIVALAGHLVSVGAKMSFEELAAHLNRNGYRNNIGHKYKRARGMAKLLSELYGNLMSQRRNADAHNVATAFVKRDGTYAY